MIDIYIDAGTDINKNIKVLKEDFIEGSFKLSSFILRTKRTNVLDNANGNVIMHLGTEQMFCFDL